MRFVGINACLVTSVGAEDVLDFNSIQINVIKTHLHRVVLAYILMTTHSERNTMKYGCFFLEGRHTQAKGCGYWLSA